MSQITVIKRDHNGHDVLSYSGVEVERDPTSICIVAHFPYKPAVFPNKVDVKDRFTLNTGDKMMEWFYSDRYYNIFRIYDGDSDQVKGWYCNLTRPAEITHDTIVSDDLALDVLFTPDGETTILDQDEYDALNLSEAEDATVQDALAQLISMFDAHQAPFDLGRIAIS
jgi:predicted RNA-binding protein associated with RNAse of E/G family